MVFLSIIIPVLNEAETIEKQLRILRSSLDNNCEIIVVDGGSIDNTLLLATKFTDRVFKSEKKGRAFQMNIGAEKAQGKLLLFLHSDTQLPLDTLTLLRSVTENQWGFFPLKLSGKAWMLRVVECLINFRSRVSSVATGDQSLFVGRNLFCEARGYADIPLMEDVDITKRLRKMCSPIILSKQVITSSRRWEEKGVWPTIFLMWRLRFLYFMGVSPQKLVKQYD